MWQLAPGVPSSPRRAARSQDPSEIAGDCLEHSRQAKRVLKTIETTEAGQNIYRAILVLVNVMYLSKVLHLVQAVDGNRESVFEAPRDTADRNRS